MKERDVRAYIDPQKTAWLDADRIHGRMLNPHIAGFRRNWRKKKKRLHSEMEERFGDDVRRTAQSVKDAFDAYVSVSDGVHPARASNSETEEIQ